MIRIGSVPYLNAKALTFGLKPSTKEYSLEYAHPSVLAARLAGGDLDVALVSSIEYFREAGAYVLLPGVSVSAFGACWSVRLFHRVPLNNVRRIAMDPASVSSNALLRIVLRHHLKRDVELFRPSRMLGDPSLMEDCDGFLKIGDVGLTLPVPDGFGVLDLGEEWRQMTGLPFVFAAWLVRKEVDLGDVASTLVSSKREGMRSLDRIAAKEAITHGLDERRLFDYLSRIVYYELGVREQAGLRQFGDFLGEMELIQKPPQALQFYGQP